MKYRTLGNTGIKVSEIGIGCEGFVDKTEKEVKAFVELMLKEGVNCIDLYTPNPDVRKNLAKAIKGYRDKFILQSHICSIWENEQYLRTRDINKVKNGFEIMLKELDTDYIDIGMIHYVDSLADLDNILNGEIVKYAIELKQQGRIKCIGMSSHNPIVAKKAVETGIIQVLMFSVNPCYDLQPADEDVEQLWNPEKYKDNLLNMDKDRQELYEACEKSGVGITVMKAFGGGDLLNDKYSPAKVSLTPLQCLHYALTRPAVASVMSGARTIEELKESIRYEIADEKEKDYASTLASFPKISWEGHCMYCGHCAPCPKGIDIASVTKFLNLIKAQGMIPETVREHYKLLQHKAGECLSCGVCEKRCPFKVEIRNNMKEAVKLFGE
ncbi:aldo/keto reductase [bacterium]|nr:aldo/keto reductase [bacterium]